METKKYNQIPIQKRMPFCATPIESIDVIHKIQTYNGHIKSIVKKKTNNIELMFPNCHSLIQSHIYNNKFEEIKLQIPFQINSINYDIAFIKHYYTRDLKHFFLTKIHNDACNFDSLMERITRYKFCDKPYIPQPFLQLANIQVKDVDKLIGKKLLCKNQEKLLPLLKKDLNILYCGDLKNNDIFINIANYNKCYYKWVLPELFNNMYDESKFDLVIE